MAKFVACRILKQHYYLVTKNLNKRSEGKELFAFDFNPHYMNIALLSLSFQIKNMFSPIRVIPSLYDLISFMALFGEYPLQVMTHSHIVRNDKLVSCDMEIFSLMLMDFKTNIYLCKHLMYL